jgi:cell division protein FtsX
MKSTWKHHEDNKALDAKERNDLPASVYAFPDKRKEPLNNASHVRNAIARFDQVKDVTDHEREQAFANLKAAAKHYGVDMPETDWHDLDKKPHTVNPKQKKSA